MSIHYNKEKQVISLNTVNSTYQMGIGKYGFLLHLYYGKKIEGDMSYLLNYHDTGFSGNPYESKEDRSFSLDTLLQEYPNYGNGDFRSVCFNVKDKDGVYGSDLRYKSHKIYKGKYELGKLPAVYAAEEQADTLELVMEDTRAGIEVTLYYGVLEELDVITRAASIRNIGENECVVTRAFSGCLDFKDSKFDLLHFHGKHCMERNLERSPLIHGKQTFGSVRGTSSHQQNPFFILADKKTTEEHGDCYGMSLLYSGNFKCEVEVDQFNQTRVILGLQDEMFEYDLKKEEVLYTPEVAYVYSGNGLANLSHKNHALIQRHICKSQYRNKRRPILINNWEATYFTFDGDKIFDIAKKAAELGVEMLVLDDGWFGKRDDDNSGLGDWFVNEEKMCGPLSNVVERINGIGMKFGLWFEPEMISEDSDLYRAHPDWAFTIPNKKPVVSRYQLVLDYSRPEVVEYVFEMVSKVLDHANIEYIKMDMNRSISDVYTAVKGKQNYGKIMYEYVLGVYHFLDLLTEKYPHLLIEGCSGGGGRFDAGMLRYTPQIWCSDNTDAIERIKIQHGTSFGYPIAAVGSHVSAVPNHQTGRITSMETRGVVAMAGSFGYELDLNKITEEEKEIVKQQIVACKKYWDLTHEGLYYRLNNPLEETDYAAWEFVSEDKKEVLLTVVTLEAHCNGATIYVKLKGLDEKAFYYMEGQEEVLYSGSALMYGGVPVPQIDNEYQAWQVHFIQK